MFASSASANVRDINPEPAPREEQELDFRVEPQGIVGLFDGDNDVWYWYSLNSGFLATGPEGDDDGSQGVLVPEELRPRTEAEFEALVGAGGEEVPAELAARVREADPDNADELLGMLARTRKMRQLATEFERYPRIGHAMYVIDPRGFTVRANSDGVGFDTDLRAAAYDQFTPVTTAEGVAYQEWGEQLGREENFDEAMALATQMTKEHYRKKPANLDAEVLEKMAKRFGPSVLHGFPSFEYAASFAFEPGDKGRLGLDEWTYIGDSAETPRGLWEQNGNKQEVGHWPFATDWAMGRNDELEVNRGDQTFHVKNPDDTNDLHMKIWVQSPSASSIAKEEAAATNRAAIDRSFGALAGILDVLTEKVDGNTEHPQTEHDGQVIQGTVVHQGSEPPPARSAIAPAAETAGRPQGPDNPRPNGQGGQKPQ